MTTMPSKEIFHFKMIVYPISRTGDIQLQLSLKKPNQMSYYKKTTTLLLLFLFSFFSIQLFSQESNIKEIDVKIHEIQNKEFLPSRARIRLASKNQNLDVSELENLRSRIYDTQRAVNTELASIKSDNRSLQRYILDKKDIKRIEFAIENEIAPTDILKIDPEVLEGLELLRRPNQNNISKVIATGNAIDDHICRMDDLAGRKIYDTNLIDKYHTLPDRTLPIGHQKTLYKYTKSLDNVVKQIQNVDAMRLVFLETDTDITTILTAVDGLKAFLREATDDPRLLLFLESLKETPEDARVLFGTAAYLYRIALGVTEGTVKAFDLEQLMIKELELSKVMQYIRDYKTCI
jgi:hypothetical protein